MQVKRRANNSLRDLQWSPRLGASLKGSIPSLRMCRLTCHLLNLHAISICSMTDTSTLAYDYCSESSLYREAKALCSSGHWS